ncbi:MAG: NADH-quinone oxidoreductase subunit F [Candidatus Cloacimonetes bacterium]|jgi:NADH:ubiquinone oxidoreductase subunit F (NADH-binding)/NADH:ubiquinone oxidoreductase subunit E|nr:NADH-quinone oxidoreductase subunit F [Candidatus Cloacimonadota bacterium]
MSTGKRKRGGAFARAGLRPAPKGRAIDAAALATVQALLGDRPRRPDLLIEYLHLLQDHNGHLPVAQLNALAFELRLTPAEVYEVATFYHHFDVVKEGDVAPPPITVRVCDSISCHLAGSDELLDSLRDALGPGIRVIPAPCVGRCDGAPVAVVGRNPIERAGTASITDAVRRHQVEPVIPEYPDYAAYRANGGYALLAECVSGARSAEDVIAQVEASGLRGLGGAGFPVHRKWQFVRSAPAPRCVAINADEGEPGTFKDRFCLESDPHRVLEGALLASWVIGASALVIYLRDEYAAVRAILEREIAALTEDPPCPLPPIQLRRGAGAYICGEETALIESTEGKRGEPRLRPPFPAQAGVFGWPTLVQNVETAYWLRTILQAGPESFRDRGLRGRSGQRYFSVSGRVRRPGVYLAGNGVSARELIELAGGMADGHELYAFLPGGASGGILPASLADEPLDFDILAPYGCFIGSAAVVILSQHDSVKDAAHNLMRFFAHESCGKCTPCRVGTAKSEVLMREETWNLPVLQDLAKVMSDASICGLGQAAPNPFRSVLRFFPQELEP